MAEPKIIVSKSTKGNVVTMYYLPPTSIDTFQLEKVKNPETGKVVERIVTVWTKSRNVIVFNFTNKALATEFIEQLIAAVKEYA